MASAIPSFSSPSSSPTTVTNNDYHDLTTLRNRRPSIPAPLTISVPSLVDQTPQLQNPPPRPPRSPRRPKSQPRLKAAASAQHTDREEVLTENNTQSQNVWKTAPPVAYKHDRQHRHRRASSSGSALPIDVLKPRQSDLDGPSCQNSKHRRSLSSVSSLSSYSTPSVHQKAASSETIRFGHTTLELEEPSTRHRPKTLPARSPYHAFPNPSFSSISPSLRREISRSLETLRQLKTHNEMNEDTVPQVRLIKPSLPPEAGPPNPRSVPDAGGSKRLARPGSPSFSDARPLSVRRSSGNLPDVRLPPAGRYTSLLSPTTPTSSTILLRPAPQSPIDRPLSPPRKSRWSPEPTSREQRFAPAASLRSSRSNLEGPPLSPASVRNSMRPPPEIAEKDLVEIPRFKKRDLNLGIVRRNNDGLDWERAAWVALWVVWLAWALIGIFFDVNVLYMLIQCAQYPSASAGSGRNWTFASAAFGISLFLTIFGIWLGWEVGYEFWRRWRVPRPAIEPIYLSLPASLHLSLISFPHFSFLTHVRLSAMSTPHALDFVPEACHMLAQTLAPTVMLLPRAALAVALLVAYSSQPPAPLVGTGIAGSMRDRDPRFFTSSHPGQLTGYSRGILIAFVSWAAFRLALLLGAWLGLWMFSGRPLAGIFGDETCCFPGFRRRHNIGPKSSQRPLSRRPSHDPSIREVPEKSWRIEEDEILWAWRERTRARIQDAFELCLVRKGPIPPSGFLNQSISWGAARWREEGSDSVRRGAGGERSPTSPGHVRTPTETGLLEEGLLDQPDLPSGKGQDSTKPSLTELGRSRPESGTLPMDMPRPANPSHSRDPSGSSLAWSPLDSARAAATGTTSPNVQLRDSDSSEERLRDDVDPGTSGQGTSSGDSKRTPTPQSSLGSKEQFFTPGVSFASKRSFLDSPFRAPSSSARSKETMRAKSASHLPTEFGVNKRDSAQSNSSEAQEDVDEDSVGLLTGTSSSPHGSISTFSGHQRNRSRSVSAGSRRPSESGSLSSSQSSRARAATNAALSRARSSSISLLQKSLAAAAAAAEGGNTVVKRVRSGTMSSQSSLSSLAGGYKRTGDEDDTVVPRSTGRIRQVSTPSTTREVLAPGFTLPPGGPSAKPLLRPGENPDLLSFEDLAARQEKTE